MKTIIILSGLCITFIPLIIYLRYLFSSIKTTPRFHYHLKKVQDKKGNLGTFVAYGYRVTASLCLTSLGIYLSSYFSNNTFLKIFFLTFVVSIILRYFDNKFDCY